MDSNLQKYLAFIKTVEYGSFTQAASRLNYSQSGISRMISDLEQEWGLTLLKRGRAGVQLTSDGRSLLPEIQALCRQYENLHTRVERLHGLQSGLIRVGTFSSVAAHWLPAVIKAFRRDYPGIDYELLTGEYGQIKRWVETMRIDCGFLLLPAHGEMELVETYEDELMAIMPEDHPLADSPVFPMKALCKYPFMLRETEEKAEITPIFEQHGLRPHVQFTTYDDYAIMSMVENGLGISILPKLILHRTPYRIVARPLEQPAYRRIGLAVKNRKTASPAVERFLTYVKREMPSSQYTSVPV